MLKSTYLTGKTPLALSEGLLRAFSIAVIVCLLACSSGDGGDTSEDDNEEEPAVPVLPSTNPPEIIDPPQDSSPIDLLLSEIEEAAALPVLAINDKIATGQPLSQLEQSCISDVDLTLGRQLKSVSCDSPWFSNEPLLSITSALFTDTDVCDQSVALGNINNCMLDSAELGFSLEWVVTTTEPGPNSPIGSLQPIAGTRISYNAASSGIVELTDSSPVTGEFRCVIELDSAALLSDQSAGNCQREIGRTLSRLFELRTNAMMDN